MEFTILQLPILEKVVKYSVKKDQRLCNLKLLHKLMSINYNFYNLISDNLNYLKRIQTMQIVFNKWKSYNRDKGWQTNTFLWNEFFQEFTRRIYHQINIQKGTYCFGVVNYQNNIFHLDRFFPKVKDEISSIHWAEQDYGKTGDTQLVVPLYRITNQFLQLCCEEGADNVERIEILLGWETINLNSFADLQNIIWNLAIIPFSEIKFAIYFKKPINRPFKIIFKGIEFIGYHKKLVDPDYIQITQNTFLECRGGGYHQIIKKIGY